MMITFATWPKLLDPDGLVLFSLVRFFILSCYWHKAAKRKSAPRLHIRTWRKLTLTSGERFQQKLNEEGTCLFWASGCISNMPVRRRSQTTWFIFECKRNKDFFFVFSDMLIQHCVLSCNFFRIILWIKYSSGTRSVIRITSCACKVVHSCLF